MKKIVILFLLGITQLNAQPDIIWQACVGGSISNGAGKMQIVSDGTIIGGYIQTDLHIVKIDHTGNLQWEKSYGGSGIDKAWGINKTADGGYILCGESSSNDGDVTGNHGLSDVWVIKTDAAGNLIWQKSFGGSNLDLAKEIVATSDGGYILTGETYSNDGDVVGNHGGGDCWVIKLDGLGNIVWQKALGGSSYDGGHSISQTLDGGYIIGGLTFSNNGDALGNHGGADCWIIKLNAFGAIEWQKQYGGTVTDMLSSIIQIPDGSYIAAADTNSNNGDVTSNHGITDGWILKISALGTLEWQKTYGGTNTEHINVITAKSNGNFVFGGYSTSTNGDVSSNNGTLDLWFAEIDPTGTLQWQKSLGGSSHETMASIHETDDGDLLIAATTGSTDFDVIGANGTSDKWVVKLSASLAVDEQKANYFVVYPNPVKNLLSFSENSQHLFEDISVFHISGKKVLTHKSLSGQLNVESLASGMYYVEATSQNIRYLKKFLKQ